MFHLGCADGTNRAELCEWGKEAVCSVPPPPHSGSTTEAIEKAGTKLLSCLNLCKGQLLDLTCTWHVLFGVFSVLSYVRVVVRLSFVSVLFFSTFYTTLLRFERWVLVVQHHL